MRIILPPGSCPTLLRYLRGCGDVADNGLPAIMHVNVFDNDLLLGGSLAAVAIQGVHLQDEEAHQP